MGKKPPEILLVEDQQSHIELIQRAFVSSTGAVNLTVSRNLQQARANLDEKSFDLVISDLLLPDGKGTELLGDGTGDTPCPIVIMTSHGDEQSAVDAMKAGALDYIVKSEGTFANMPLIARRALREWKHITERQRAEEALHWELDVNKARAELSNALMAASVSLDDIVNIVLDYAKSLTKSEHGYVSVVDEATGDNICLTHARMMDTCPVSGEDRKISFPRGPDGRYPTLWGHALNTLEAFYANSPRAHPESCGTPDGHLPVKNFLTVPVVSGGNLLGQIALANAENDYTDRDLEAVRQLADFYALVLLRRRAEDRLRDSEQRYRLLFESNPHPMWVYELETLSFLAVNDAAVNHYGYTREEFLSMTLKDIRPPEYVPALLDTVSKVAEGLDVVPYTKHRKKDGTEIDVEITSHTLQFMDKRAELVLAHDISARRRADEERRTLEAQVQQAQKLESLGVLAGGIAHDFNNLLTSVLGNAELALDDLSPVSPVRHNIQDIETAAKRAAELSRQMLAYSGKGRFIVEPLNLNEVIQEMTHLLDVSISKKVVLKYDLAADLPSVEADAAQIRQVIMNLITNASEAIGDTSGVVSIRTSAMECDRAYLDETWLVEQLPEGDYVYVEVADTGCGMDEETMAKIFDPFYTTKFTGRGLGLAAALGIVRGHKGAIKIYSEPGRGTTFKILFPAVDRPARPGATEAEAAKPWRGSGTILLVDDEEVVRVVGKRVLQKAGFTVLTADNGREAVEVFREHAKETVCVVLDLTMPHMDGEVTFRELRRIHDDVRVILSSGYNEQEVITRFAGKGLAGFVQKPYRSAYLLDKIRQVLEE